MLSEPRWIDESEVLAMHAQQIERYGGMHGIRDASLILAALARPRHRWTYQPDADVFDLAAAYLVGLCRQQGFLDGNKRTALATALVFLAVNGRRIRAPDDDLYALVIKTAVGEADDHHAAAYFRSCVGLDV